MSEDEAKKKTCPHTIAGATLSATLAKMLGEPTNDQITNIVKIGLCNASDCMMWQTETGTCGLTK